ncbi:MAE_28990/MAE_18760 family HEPN-like nuclease [Deinococcus hohokamensis]|uniref:MAE_28990/MAE_18760 family HEPN-like nuclease n=1 Tax=Deinococcus hohokamensis TaxID=309883 RepID=A0ABV9ICG4_9DEIO
MSNLHASLAGVEVTFTTRKQEVDEYINFVRGIYEKEVEAKYLTGPLAGQAAISRSLQKVLLANSFLLMYNIIEATVYNIMDSIYSHYISEGVEFDNLAPEIKLTMMKIYKVTASDESIKTCINLSKEVVVKAYEMLKENDFKLSGNIDARKIRDISGDYNFSLMHDKELTRNGTGLLEIKTKRNKLAHGNISFLDCGQDSSIDNVVKIWGEVKLFLEGVIDGVDDYLNHSKYLN